MTMSWYHHSAIYSPTFPCQSQVWEVSSGRMVFSMAHKQVAKDAWPVLHWAHDDSCFMHMVTNTLHVYSRADGFAGEAVGGGEG